MGRGLGLYVGNVGQGQCVTFIVGTGAKVSAAIVDVGGDGKSLAGWLQDMGVRFIATIVLTHNDKDHTQGLAAVVEAFAGRIGTIYYVFDRSASENPHWLPLQEWLAEKKIHAFDLVCPKDTSDPTTGKALLEDDFAGFQLYCAYPTFSELAAVALEAPLLGRSPGRGQPNAASAVIRLVRDSTPDRTIALLGGDLTFSGWNRLRERNCDLRTEVLIVPHHGSAAGKSRKFGPKELADATMSKYALISVGTENNFGHPDPESIRAYRDAGSVVACTQITSKCHKDLKRLPGRAVLPPDPTDPKCSGSEVPCAGTIAVRVTAEGRVKVARIDDHQAAVDALPKAPDCPLCRT